MKEESSKKIVNQNQLRSAMLEIIELKKVIYPGNTEALNRLKAMETRIAYAGVIEDFFLELINTVNEWKRAEINNKDFIHDVVKVNKIVDNLNKHTNVLREVLDEFRDEYWVDPPILEVKPFKKKLTEQEVISQPFNIETHKETFTNYLEVIIFPNGVIEYANPSHNDKLFMIAYKNTTGEDISFSDSDYFENKKLFENNVPKEWWLDMIQYYVNLTGCVCVWKNKAVIPRQELSSEQITSLISLAKENLYSGYIPL